MWSEGFLLCIIYFRPLFILGLDVGKTHTCIHSSSSLSWRNKQICNANIWRRKAFNLGHMRFWPALLRGGYVGDYLMEDSHDIYEENDVNDEELEESVQSSNDQKDRNSPAPSEASTILHSFEKQLRQIRHEIEEEAFRELENIKSEIIQKQLEQITASTTFPVEEERNHNEPAELRVIDDVFQHNMDNVKGEAQMLVDNTKEARDDDVIAAQSVPKTSIMTDFSTPTIDEPILEGPETAQDGYEDMPPRELDFEQSKKDKVEIPVMEDEEPTLVTDTMISPKKKISRKKKRSKITRAQEGRKKKAVEVQVPTPMEEESFEDEKDMTVPTQDEAIMETTLHEEDQDLMSVIRENVLQLLVTIVLMMVTHFLCQFVAKKLQLLPN